MARKRMIHPSFFQSATMNALPVETMLTFAGVWCWVDDFGRAEDEESLAKAAIWPRRKSITERKVRAMLDQLAAVDVLCQYEVTGHLLLHVVNWREHQTVSHPTRSKLPPCPKHEPDEWETFLTEDDSVTNKFRPSSGTFRERLPNAS